MNSEIIIYLLWLGLAIALITATITDLKSRIISNKLNLLIALGAPILWVANGMSFWPEIVQQVGFALLIFTIFAAMFAMGAMGGGDVKLLAALALWFHWLVFVKLMLIMSIAGGVLTLGLMLKQKLQNTKGRLKIPYGFAIALSALWLVWQINAAPITEAVSNLTQTIY